MSSAALDKSAKDVSSTVGTAGNAPKPLGADGSPVPQSADRSSSLQEAEARYLTLEELVEQIAAGLQIFMVAIKNNSLYPENSSIRQDSLTKLHQWLGAFVNEHESVRLFIDPDSLLFQGAVVHKDRPNEPNLIFPLFRDGLQWIEFQDGLSSDELHTFISLLNRFRQLKEDDEDDIVTAMWGAGLEFIRYKTANEFWDIDPLTEIASFSAGPGEGEGGGTSLAEKGAKEGRKSVVGLFRQIDEIDPAEDLKRRESSAAKLPDSLKRLGAGGFSGGGQEDDLEAFDKISLSPEEKEYLNELLLYETRPKPLLETVEPAMDLLWRLPSLSQAIPVLNFLAEAVKFSLAAGNFDQILHLHSSLANLVAQAGPRLEGSMTYFQKRVSSREILEGLSIYRPPENMSEEVLEKKGQELEAALLSLSPTAAKELVLVCLSVQTQRLVDAILRVVAAMSPEGGSELVSMINSALPSAKILRLIEHLKWSGKGQAMLSGLTRHTEPQIREAAAAPLLAENPEHIATMTHLLNEPDPGLNRIVHHHISQQRNKTVEKIVLSFLRQSYETNTLKSPSILFNAYRSLGKTALSPAASEFAEGVLNKKSARALLGLEIEYEVNHRAGAALALSLMGSREAVEKAAHSMYKDIRRACRLAEEELARSGRKG
ncbi:MAG: hypothetical protein LBJ64_05735 [Deltaproteobacteria bacterium]|jgi:hypothetical protein|nr:hypothetical protein [Deltaproteobacteria bacterium]